MGRRRSTRSTSACVLNRIDGRPSGSKGFKASHRVVGHPSFGARLCRSSEPTRVEVPGRQSEPCAEDRAPGSSVFRASIGFAARVPVRRAVESDGEPTTPYRHRPDAMLVRARRRLKFDWEEPPPVPSGDADEAGEQTLYNPPPSSVLLPPSIPPSAWLLMKAATQSSPPRGTTHWIMKMIRFVPFTDKPPSDQMAAWPPLGPLAGAARRTRRRC